jgi:hypothetical protein
LAHLEAIRERETEFFDAGSLYTTILNSLKDIKECSTGLKLGYQQLFRLLLRLGTNYYDYAAVFAEQEMIRGNTITHPSTCNLCVPLLGQDIRGPRFVCLDCIDGDFCTDRHANWEKSNGEMDYCKGHTYFEIPRPCWYQFREGVAMEDGSTFPQVIDFLVERFTVLLASAGSLD